MSIQKKFYLQQSPAYVPIPNSNVLTGVSSGPTGGFHGPTRGSNGLTGGSNEPNKVSNRSNERSSGLNRGFNEPNGSSNGPKGASMGKIGAPMSPTKDIMGQLRAPMGQTRAQKCPRWLSGSVLRRGWQVSGSRPGLSRTWNCYLLMIWVSTAHIGRRRGWEELRVATSSLKLLPIGVGWG